MTRDNHRPDLGRTQADHERRIGDLERRLLPRGKTLELPAGDIVLCEAFPSGGWDLPTGGTAEVGTRSFSTLSDSYCVALARGIVSQNSGGAGDPQLWTCNPLLSIDGTGDLGGGANLVLAGSVDGDSLTVSLMEALAIPAGAHQINISGSGTPQTGMNLSILVVCYARGSTVLECS